MSERGLLLALQRLHDDPGFSDMVCSDPERTLGLYDLDDNDRSLLTNACQNKNTDAIAQLARSYGIEWQSDSVAGAGALSDEEVSIEQQRQPGIHGPEGMHTPPAGTAVDGYAGAQPTRPAGT